MIIPPHIIAELRFEAERQGYGFGEIQLTDIIKIFIFGRKEMTPDMAATVGAHLLLEGIINKRWTQTNEDNLEDEIKNAKLPNN